MAREAKTNAMRMLDRAKISYEVIKYDCEDFIDGIHVARKTGAPVEQSFKTLVTRGKSGQHYVCVLPVAAELDLKKAARIIGEKSLEMLHVKDINKVTGYVRGGCSPLGMKKQFPAVIHESAREYDRIYISGGRIGVTIVVAPEPLAELTGAKFADIAVAE